MLTKFIMRSMGWDAVFFVNRGLGLAPLWHVGVWTGPEMDLVCVRWASTNDEAWTVLSPSSRTLVGAAIRAWWKARGVKCVPPMRAALLPESAK